MYFSPKLSLKRVNEHNQVACYDDYMLKRKEGSKGNGRQGKVRGGLKGGNLSNYGWLS